MTYLELVNEVLREMREDEVTTVSETEYSTLIGQFVNYAKERVERAWDWGILRDTIRLTTSIGTHEYVLTGAGKKFRILKRVAKAPSELDVYDDTNDVFLRKADSSWLTTRFNDNNVESGIPVWFDFNSYDSSGDPYVNLFPVPSGTYNINFNMVIPQAKLTSESTELLVPEEPVIRLAYYRAVRERGDELGAALPELYNDYKEVLAETVIEDRMRYPEYNTWIVE
jgi:hypothetical protein